MARKGERSRNFRVYRHGTPAARELERRLLARRSEIVDADDLVDQVRVLLDRVERGGRAALAALVKRYDETTLGPEELAVPATRHAPERSQVPADFRRSLTLAIRRVAAFAQCQVPKGFEVRDRAGVFGERIHPLESVGCYVPGGNAAYPSTAVMTVVPARVAEVPRIVVATPPKAYFARPELRWAIAEAGATEVLLAGGAHALAGLAFGFEGFDPVRKIVGPGSRYVNAAKRLLFGRVAVDSLAGPTEVLVFADGSAEADWIAADLLAQAEHDAQAAALLITTDDEIVRPVAIRVEQRLAQLPAASPAWASIPKFGGALVMGSREAAIDWIERFAPEHLELMTRDAVVLSRNLRNCGAIFVGQSTSEVFGDYVAGPNHVLPTGGGARAFSALSAADFVRRTNLLTITPDGAAMLAADAATLARSEGLVAHAAAADARRGG